MTTMIRTLALYAAVLTATANMDLAFDSMLPVKATGTNVAPKIMDFTKNPGVSETGTRAQSRVKKSLSMNR